MATHRFEGDGESPIEVEVERAATGVVIRIDEETFHASVIGQPDGGSLRLDGATDDAVARIERIHAVDEGDAVSVWWRGRTWRLPVVERRARRAGDAAGAAGGDEVAAPMPGTVLAVKVAVGDTVGRDTVVVVMESMKMEMSLPAARDAVVSEVLVAEGDMVELGRPLVRFESAPAAAADGESAVRGPAGG